MFVFIILTLGGEKKFEFVRQPRRRRTIFDIQISSEIYRKERNRLFRATIIFVLEGSVNVQIANKIINKTCF